MEYEVISHSDIVRINVQLTRLEFLHHSFSGILACVTNVLGIRAWKTWIEGG